MLSLLFLSSWDPPSFSSPTPQQTPSCRRLFAQVLTLWWIWPDFQIFTLKVFSKPPWFSTVCTLNKQYSLNLYTVKVFSLQKSSTWKSIVVTWIPGMLPQKVRLPEGQLAHRGHISWVFETHLLFVSCFSHSSISSALRTSTHTDIRLQHVTQATITILHTSNCNPHTIIKDYCICLLALAFIFACAYLLHAVPPEARRWLWLSLNQSWRCLWAASLDLSA